MLEQGRGGRSDPILTKWQVKPHTFDPPHPTPSSKVCRKAGVSLQKPKVSLRFFLVSTPYFSTPSLKCTERLESCCRSNRCRCSSFWPQPHTFQLFHKSVQKVWSRTAEATGVAAVLSGFNHIPFDSSNLPQKCTFWL